MGVLIIGCCDQKKACLRLVGYLGGPKEISDNLNNMNIISD